MLRTVYRLEVRHPLTGEWLDAQGPDFGSATQALIFGFRVYGQFEFRAGLSVGSGA